MPLKCTACGKEYQPPRAVAAMAAGGAYPTQMTQSSCECGNNSFEGEFMAGGTADGVRALTAIDLMARERIGVLAADPPRTDWCGYMTRRRHKRKGFESWSVYAPTPVEAIEAVYAEYIASTRSDDQSKVDDQEPTAGSSHV